VRFRFASGASIVLLALAVSAQEPVASEDTGSRACAACHEEIYRSYVSTAMARTAGRVGTGPFRESFERSRFTDSATGAEFRVSAGDGGYTLGFGRTASGIEGQRELEWFIGSGRVGRSYLFSIDGFLFQSPVSYYSSQGRWDVSPGYQRRSNIELARGIETACLQCHASRLQPAAGTPNGFASPPFQEGISCERCHGPGRNHIAHMSGSVREGPLQIVNPAKLEPARRDSVCAQCHLTGAARVARVRTRATGYQPGELLSDYSASFVWADTESAGLTVTSHYEKLVQSACKKSSGDRFWCGSCHDPHGEPAPEERAGFYRSRCSQCHETSACKESAEARRRSADDCAACHMPKGTVEDAQHTVYTDHSIPRRPRPAVTRGTTGRELASFWKTAVDDRDVALAYGSAAGADRVLQRRAFELLQAAATHDPDDIAVASQLAQIYDRIGNADRAAALYERVLAAEASNVAAAINLGTLLAQQGRTADAIRLWEGALKRAPGHTGARVNLAVAQFRAGDAAAAEATLRRALDYDPDHPLARKLLAKVQAVAR
jgi:Flp pilus assembly protein TadD